MLLETVESEFRLVIDKDFKRLMIKVVPSIIELGKTKLNRAYVRHEFLARHPNLLAQRGTEHHNLLMMGG